tara:strand:- start:1509 stop:1994 length:486 start_codon:yes stop_codon:yes gene_type:complete
MENDAIFEMIDDEIDENDESVEEIDGTYQFGICIIDQERNTKKIEIHYVMKMPVQLLYKYSTKLDLYLETFKGAYVNKPKLEIFKVKLNKKGIYKAILTTYWIRLIQKAWKKHYHNKMKIIKKNMNPNALRYRELHGCFRERIPSNLLKGLMTNKFCSSIS